MIQLIKKFVLAALLLTGFMAFADEPGTDMEEADGSISSMGLEEEAPINSKLAFLALGAAAFAFYYFNDRRKPIHK